jgi:hypothetical protein
LLVLRRGDGTLTQAGGEHLPSFFSPCHQSV